MRDGLSAVQVITEMREQETNVQPDKRHFAMAMFTCITGNQCNLAESLFTFYTKLYGKPDTALCSLNLRALLQQKKWEQAYAFCKLMEEGKILSFPNIQTLNYLLQYQVRRKFPFLPCYIHYTLCTDYIVYCISIFPSWVQLLEEKFEEAQLTLKKIFRVVFATSLSIVSSPSCSPAALDGTYEALSILLGPYSAHMQRMIKEDSAFQARMSTQDGALMILGTEAHRNIAYYCQGE